MPETIPMPKDAVEYDGKVYRRKPMRGIFNALVLIGKLEDIKDANGKPIGQRTFVPLARQEGSADPLKQSKKSAKKAA